MFSKLPLLSGGLGLFLGGAPWMATVTTSVSGVSGGQRKRLGLKTCIPECDLVINCDDSDDNPPTDEIDSDEFEAAFGPANRPPASKCPLTKAQNMGKALLSGAMGVPKKVAKGLCCGRRRRALVAAGVAFGTQQALEHHCVAPDGNLHSYHKGDFPVIQEYVETVENAGKHVYSTASYYTPPETTALVKRNVKLAASKTSEKVTDAATKTYTVLSSASGRLAQKLSESDFFQNTVPGQLIDASLTLTSKAVANTEQLLSGALNAAREAANDSDHHPKNELCAFYHHRVKKGGLAGIRQLSEDTNSLIQEATEPWADSVDRTEAHLDCDRAKDSFMANWVLGDWLGSSDAYCALYRTVTKPKSQANLVAKKLTLSSEEK